MITECSTCDAEGLRPPAGVCDENMMFHSDTGNTLKCLDNDDNMEVQSSPSGCLEVFHYT